MVAILYSNEELLEKNRNIFNDYLEVYIKADIETLEKREFKGLYRGAKSGHIKDVVGVDIEWIEPKKPDMVFDISSKDYQLDEMSRLLRQNIIS